MVRSGSSADHTSLRQAVDHPIFDAVSRAAQSLEQPAFVIGGYVRDHFIGRSSKDVDFVIAGNGIELARRTAVILGLGENKVTVYKNFGTAMFHYGHWQLEFVGARKESYRSDSRKPSVENGSLKDDQFRRDFTINALAISLDPKRFGELVDPFNGLTHLKEKKIITPLDPDATFSDDPLRMMRAIRFATQLHFSIDPRCLKAIRANRHRIAIVSQERITTELNKIIAAPKPGNGFRLLFETGLLELIFPEMQRLHGVEEKNGVSHKDNFFHTLEVLDNVADESDKLWLRWAAILHDIAKPQTKRFSQSAGWTFHGHEDKGARMVPHLFRKMKLPLDQKMKYVRKLVFLHLRPIALTKKVATDSAIRRLIFEAGNDLEDLMILCKADITSKNERKKQRYLENYDRVMKRIQEVEEKDRVRNWQPPVSGEEIIAYFGIRPGREVGILKNAIKEAILDGDIDNNKDAAIAFMRKKGIDMGLTPADSGDKQ